MTTYYVDLVNGNDANGGTSFALRKKTLASVTAALLNPGDTVRIMASDPPVSLGINGTWTDGPKGSSVNITSSTNASPIVVTLSSANFALLNPANNDTVLILSHGTNTAANGVWTLSAVDSVNKKVTLLKADGSNSVGNGVGGATGTIQKVNNCVVTLASALTKNIACFGNTGDKTNWTASANITCSVNTGSYKEGVAMQRIDIGAAFTTGLAAYWATGTLDLSAYQKVSFWAVQSTGTLAVAGDYKLCLCTDTVGAVPVHDIPIPVMSNGRFQPVTVDLGAAMNSGIKSIAFYVNVDRGATSFFFDNIFACNTLSLQSLIGKNTGTETWCAIQSINSVRVVLDQGPTSSGGVFSVRGYSGVTETVTAYRRETIKTPIANSGLGSVDSGSSGSLLTYSGGWNQIDMSTRTDETWVDGLEGTSNGWNASSKTFNKIENWGFVRYNNGMLVNTNCDDWTISNCHFNNNAANGMQNFGGFRWQVTARSGSYNSTSGLDFEGGTDTGVGSSHKNQLLGCDHADGNGTNGVTMGNSQGNHLNWRSDAIGSACNNGNTGVSLATQGGYIGTITRASGNSSNGVSLQSSSYCYIGRILEANQNGVAVLSSLSAENFIGELVAANNVTRTITLGSNINFNTNSLYVHKLTSTDASIVGGFTGSGRRWERCWIDNLNGNGPFLYTDMGSISGQTTTRHTASGIAWKFSPTSSECDVTYPLTASVARIAVQANKLCTVRCWGRRDNTGITLTLRLRLGQLLGITSDVTATAVAAANTWEELVISFTPTEQGVVEILGEAYGGTTYSAFLDDFSAAQGGRLIRSTLDNVWHGQPFAPVGPNSVGAMFLVFP